MRQYPSLAYRLRALISAQTIARAECASAHNAASVCASARSLKTRAVSDLAHATAQHARACSVRLVLIDRALAACKRAVSYAKQPHTVAVILRLQSLTIAMNRALARVPCDTSATGALVSVARAAFAASLAPANFVIYNDFSATDTKIVIYNKKQAMLGNIASSSLPMYVRDLAQSLNLSLDRTSVHVATLPREQAAVRLACSVHAFAHSPDSLSYQTVLANIAALAAAQLVQSDNYRHTLPTLHPTATLPEPFPMPLKHACSTSLEWQTNPSIGVNPAKDAEFSTAPHIDNYVPKVVHRVKIRPISGKTRKAPESPRSRLRYQASGVKLTLKG